MDHKILVINTGSTSTKIALFIGYRCTYENSLSHSAEELQQYPSLFSQYPYRKEIIKDALAEDQVDLNALSAVAARGGTFGYASGGAYLVEENLLWACKNPITEHPSNLSAMIASDLAGEAGCKAYIYDAVCVNEVSDIARYTGLVQVKRRPFSHVLNTRAVAREIAGQLDMEYEDGNFIVAHLGGGISINLHEHGRIVDLLCDDEGPMSPERVGRLNGKSYVDLCFSGKYDKAGMMRLLKGGGGLVDYLGTSDLRLVEKMVAEGNRDAAEVVAAMAYQVAKGIASLAAVVCGDVTRIILTGGGAYCRILTEPIAQRVSFIASVEIVPGAREMAALAAGVQRVLEGREEIHIYINEREEV